MESLQNIRIYAKLFREQTEFCRLCVMLNPQMNVIQIKNKIEEEYSELFPAAAH